MIYVRYLSRKYLIELHNLQIEPKLSVVLDRISVALGRPSLKNDLASAIIGARTNNLGLIEMAEQLLQLRSQLLYR